MSRRHPRLVVAAALAVAAAAAIALTRSPAPSRPAALAASARRVSGAYRPTTAAKVSHPRRRHRASAAWRPQPIVLGRAPAYAGEGVWRRRDPWAGSGPPAVATTTFEVRSGVVAYLARIWPQRSLVSLVAGTAEPPLGPGHAGEVPAALRPRLLATFNSGFKYAAAPGGFVAQGVTYAPLRQGLATLVVTWNHHADVVAWNGATPPAEIRLARQNLTLLVDAGRPVATAGDTGAWGATIGPLAVWRTGIGIEPDGSLVYAGVSNATALDLADVLVRAGAVRAMQLDINPDWPAFNLYGGPGATAPVQFVPNPNQSASRYLVPDARDFFVVSALRR